MFFSTAEVFEPEDSDEDFCDAEIKLRPEAVRFIPDDNDLREHDKLTKPRLEDDLLVLTAHEGHYGGEMLRYAALVKSSPPPSPGNSSQDSPLPEKVHYFGDLESRDGQSAWYDCTLGRPASREVRDSYDQFCTVASDVGSRDSINKSPTRKGKKALYEHFGNKAYLVQKFGSNNSLPERRDGNVLRNTRFQPKQRDIPRDRGVPRRGTTLGRTQPHHWSLPAVFTRHQDSSNNSDGRGSDSDSGDSLRRGRRGRPMRPQSVYEGRLLPISEQDSDPKLRCTCEEEEEFDSAKRREGNTAASLRRGIPDEECSYLHLDRSDSQKLSFVEQLKGWSDDTGQPYDSHRRKEEKTLPAPIDTDSENSVSPAISLASLSETESDRDITQKLHDSQQRAEDKILLSRDQKQATLPRTALQLKSVDSESSSDDQGRRGTRERQKKPSSPIYKDKKPPSVTNLNLNPLERVDSLDQLKACDPFFQGRHRVSRSSSNASSGICSIQISSSETNSMDSPREISKRSRASERASSGYASSRDSYENRNRLRAGDHSKVLARRPLNGLTVPRSEEPYELDPSSSEMDELEIEGASYNPKMYEDLMALQQRMGVNLDGSDSSRESFKEMENLSRSELLEYTPQVSPTKYKVDLLSEAEKDKRCSKLMEEYKTNKKLQDVRDSGSQIYRTWNL